MIQILDQNTINQIAAGEVIERPEAVVKELVENAIDAKATAITVEIKDGGTSLIRVTDNGGGISKEEVQTAFLRHATSKIKTINDLLAVSSLGFRGEALSSIASVAEVEVLTKVREELLGVRYCIEGGIEKKIEAIGCPDGTTFLVRNLFYNTPARLKFLKSNVTEAGYIQDIMERIAISRPDISIKFVNQNQIKMQTPGNGSRKDVIYRIFGREIASNLTEVEAKGETIAITGFVGKPVIARGNRNFENYYINGRYIKNAVINRAIEEAYKPYMMQHRYPFTGLIFQMDSKNLDVNVHPSKKEVRFKNADEVYDITYQAVKEALERREFIQEVILTPTKEITKPKIQIPEPFEVNRRAQMVQETPIYATNGATTCVESIPKEPIKTEKVTKEVKEPENLQSVEQTMIYEQEEIDTERFLTKEARKHHHIIGQIFETYWIIEYQDKMFLVDQHAAHEKVLYERTMKRLNQKEHDSQMLMPPIILSLNIREEAAMKKLFPELQKLGFEVEYFGGKEYTVSAVPADLFHLAKKELLIELLDHFVEEERYITPDILLEKVASMSCKAAVKGNNKLSYAEAEALMDELLELENPYHCPHGRPTIISMSKYEIEKKFKRIV